MTTSPSSQPIFSQLSSPVLYKRRLLSRPTPLHLRLVGSVISAHLTPSSPPEWHLSLTTLIPSRPYPRTLFLQQSPRSHTSPHYFHFPSRVVAQEWLIAFEQARIQTITRDYILGRKIGEGAFAKVYQATRRSDECQVAVKVIQKCIHDARMARELMREMSVGSRLRHDGIVAIERVYYAVDSVHIVMELMHGGTLKDAVQNCGGTISEIDARAVMAQIVAAVAYLHATGIVHRDLKLENVLLEQKGNLQARVRIADFGYVNFVADGEDCCLRSLVGTPVYVAPEVIRREAYGRPVDMYALGVMLYRMVSGKYPFDGGENDEETMALAVKGGVSFDGPVWERVSSICRQFIATLLESRVEKRITAQEALSHEWLAAVQVLPDEGLLSSPVTDCAGDDVFSDASDMDVKELARKRWRVAVTSVMFLLQLVKGGRKGWIQGAARRRRRVFQILSIRRGSLAASSGISSQWRGSPTSESHRGYVSERLRRTFSLTRR